MSAATITALAGSFVGVVTAVTALLRVIMHERGHKATPKLQANASYGKPEPPA